MPSGAGAWLVPPVALTLMNQVRAWKHDTDLGNRLTDQTVGLLGRDAVLTIGLTGPPPLCGHPRWPGLRLAMALSRLVV